MNRPFQHALSAQAQASFSGEKGFPISLDRDTSGKDQEKACTALFKADPPGIMKFDSIEPGHAVVRLWSPSAAIHAYATFTDSPALKLGTRRETIAEVVSFSGSAEGRLSKGYSASGVTVLAATPFVNKTGGAVNQPAYANGIFTANEPAYGALVVEYTAIYTAYKIPYGLPEWAIQKIFRDGQNREDVTLPPVLVMAFTGGQAASLQIERRIANIIPPDCKDDDWLVDAGESEWVEYRIFPASEMNQQTGLPKNNANYLVARDYVKKCLYCKNRVSRKRVENIPLPSGNNIQIIRTGKGL